jgi:two-component system OmpR family response regulator
MESTPMHDSAGMRTREHDQIDAFDLGADDYLTKPFVFKVLVARLRALMRRGACERPVVLTAGSLSLDPVRRCVAREGTPIELTPREFGVLEHLMRYRNTVVTKADLLEHVWDPRYHGADNVVEVYVGYLRRRIDMPFGTMPFRRSVASVTSSTPASIQVPATTRDGRNARS